MKYNNISYGCAQPRQPFILYRAHVAASLVSAGGEFIVDSCCSCADVGSLSHRRVDYVQLLVTYAQKSDQLTTFLSSQLDVPVSHAFFVHGAAGQLGLRKFRRVQTHHWLESVTVSVSCTCRNVDVIDDNQIYASLHDL